MNDSFEKCHLSFIIPIWTKALSLHEILWRNFFNYLYAEFSISWMRTIRSNIKLGRMASAFPTDISVTFNYSFFNIEKSHGILFQPLWTAISNLLQTCDSLYCKEVNIFLKEVSISSSRWLCLWISSSLTYVLLILKF